MYTVAIALGARQFLVFFGGSLQVYYFYLDWYGIIEQLCRDLFDGGGKESRVTVLLRDGGHRKDLAG